MNDENLTDEEMRIEDVFVLRQRLHCMEDVLHYNITSRMGDIYDVWLKKFDELIKELNEIIVSDLEKCIKNKKSK